jgi:hypothetical protein
MKGLMILRYLGQMDVVPKSALQDIQCSLAEFHTYKGIIHRLGLRKTPGWNIPKFAHLSNLVWSILAVGAAQQYSTETPESLHKMTKKAIKTGNNWDDPAQICRSLAASEARQFFHLYLQEEAQPEPDEEELEIEDGGEDDNDKGNIEDDANNSQPTQEKTRFQDLFLASSRSTSGLTFCTPTTAFRLTTRADFDILTLEEAAKLYRLPDLVGACDDYYRRLTRIEESPSSDVFPSFGGPRRSDGKEVADVPFNKIKVWRQVRVQTRSVQGDLRLRRSVALQAWPPGYHKDWPHGRTDTWIIANNMRTVSNSTHIDMSGK